MFWVWRRVASVFVSPRFPFTRIVISEDSTRHTIDLIEPVEKAEELTIVVILPSDLLKNISLPVAYISKGYWGSALTSIGCRAPDVVVVYISAPWLGEGTIVLVVDFDKIYVVSSEEWDIFVLKAIVKSSPRLKLYFSLFPNTISESEPLKFIAGWAFCSEKVTFL